MTIKEAKFIEAKVKGKSGIEAAMIATGTKNKKTANVQAHRMMHRPSVQQELDKLLKKQGITLKKALKPIGEALQATKVISAVSGGDANGATTDFIDVPDHATRLKAADMSLKLLGIKTSVKVINPMSHNTNERMTPEMEAAMESGDEVELQKAIFRKA